MHRTERCCRGALRASSLSRPPGSPTAQNARPCMPWQQSPPVVRTSTTRSPPRHAGHNTTSACRAATPTACAEPPTSVDRLEHIRAAFDHGGHEIGSPRRHRPHHPPHAGPATKQKPPGNSSPTAKLELIGWAARPPTPTGSKPAAKPSAIASTPTDHPTVLPNRPRCGSPASSMGRWSLSGDLSADDGALLAAYLERRTRAELRLRHHRTTPARATTTLQSSEEQHADRRDPRPGTASDFCRDGAGSNQPGRIAAHLHIDLDDLTSRGTNTALRPRTHRNQSRHHRRNTLGTPRRRPTSPPTSLGTADAPSPTAPPADSPPKPSVEFLAHRDRTCRFPGCNAPPIWHDAHHVKTRRTDHGHHRPRQHDRPLPLPPHPPPLRWFGTSTTTRRSMRSSSTTPTAVATTSINTGNHANDTAIPSATKSSSASGSTGALP